MSSKKIPAYVEGLWRAWADWLRQDMDAGDLDLWASETTVSIRGNGKSDGPVLRAIMAMEAADHGEAGFVHVVYRQMTKRCQRVLLYHYVGQRPLDEIPQVPKTTAYTDWHKASAVLRQWIIGVQVLKGDDEAARKSVEAGRRKRLAYAGC